MSKKSTDAAPANAGAAALSEVVDEGPRSIKFRELELELPRELPPTILFDLTDLESTGENAMPIFRMLKSLLGPEQFVQVRNVLKPDDSVSDLVDEMLGDIFTQYGVSLGE